MAPSRSVASVRGFPPRLFSLGFEVRILNDAQSIPERVVYFANQYAISDILHFFLWGRAQCQQALICAVHILDSPVRYTRRSPLRSRIGLRNYAKLIAADIESHIKGLIKIWLDAEDAAVPGLRFREILGVVFRGSQTQKHGEFLSFGKHRVRFGNMRFDRPQILADKIG